MRALALSAALLLAACSGDMRGSVQSPDGAPQGGATMVYRSNGFGSGTLDATLPDGETFSGSFSDTRVSAAGFGTTRSSTGSASTSSYATASADQYFGILHGSRGSSMRCLLQGDSFGGIGQCEVSDGRTVDVSW